MAAGLKPLTAALLLSLSGTAKAEEAAADKLPDLGRPTERTGTVTAGPNGVTLDNRFDGKRLLLSPEYSQQTGISLGGAFAFPMGDGAAGGLLVSVGGKKQELLFNAGFQLDEVQRLILTAGQLRQHLNIGFVSGSESVALAQNNGAVSYQRFLGHGLLNAFEFNGYLSDTPSRKLADKTYTVDSATLYELWNDPRRVAGGRVTGLQGRLGFTPFPGGSLKLGLGGERLEYDYLTGRQSTTRGTASAVWTQRLADRLNLKAGLDGAAAQNRFTLGVEQTYSDGWKFGINATAIQGRDGAPNDSRLTLAWNYDFGGKGAASPDAARVASPDSTAFHPGYSSGNPDAAKRNPGNSPAWGSLLDQVAMRPAFLPAQMVAKLDTTATPLRLIAVNKAALPAGSAIASSAIITVPLGVAVTTIAGVTLNGGAFASGGQFVLSGNNLLVDPNKITQPAVGVIDTYVVTVNNAGGGTTLVTVVVSRGSVKIDSITIAGGPAAPTASAVSITGTATVGQTLTGSYTYADANGDPQGVSTFRWLRNGVAIAGATAATYTLVAADYGTAITFEVTPVATVAPTTGTAVTSGATTVTGGGPAAPTASAVSITGTATVGQTLTGHYTYADANGDPQGASTFRWLRNGVAIAGATAATYTLVAADYGQAITFEVTPVATVAPTTGTAVTSGATTVTGGGPAAPTASAVSITGTATVGQTFTGHYTYADANGDPQGASTFRWLRNGVAIAGATASTYTLVAADYGTAISFEVTPVATVAPTTGTAVASGATTVNGLPAGYVAQGGRLWMPNNVVNPPNGWDTWSNANTYCTTATIQGQTGWRLPTLAELSALYNSGAMNGQGWQLAGTWSSDSSGAGGHDVVNLGSGGGGWVADASGLNVTCVR